MAVRLSTLRSGSPLPPGRFLVLISVRGGVDSRAGRIIIMVMMTVMMMIIIIIIIIKQQQ
jgi:hypothetical protein